MRYGFRFTLAPAFCFTFGTVAYADLPLTIENLITDTGKVRLNLSLNYANSEREGSLLAQTSTNSYTWVPTKNNSNILIGSLSLGYGLTHNTEIYERGNYFYSNSRTNSLGGISIAEDNRFLDA